MELEGKIIVVTGASGGIGQATARALVARDARVVLHACSHHDRLVELEAELGDDAVTMMVSADFRRPAEIAGMFAVIRDEHQSIDGLVNVAGIEPAFDDPLDSTDWRDVFDVNVFGAVECVRHALTMMSAGVVINVSSVAGASRVAFAGDSLAYAASKAALDKMTEQLALMVAPDRRVVGVAPGYTRTPMWARFPDDVQAECERDVPLLRLLDPEEVAAAVVFAFENDALTGTTITLDAGLGIRHVR